jgi:hypothetical protein
MVERAVAHQSMAAKMSPIDPIDDSGQPCSFAAVTWENAALSGRTSAIARARSAVPSAGAVIRTPDVGA